MLREAWSLYIEPARVAVWLFLMLVASLIVLPIYLRGCRIQ